MITISRKDILHTCLEAGILRNRNQIIKCVQESIRQHQHANKHSKTISTKSLKNLVTEFTKKMKKVKSTKQRFLAREKKWLESEIQLNESDQFDSETESSQELSSATKSSPKRRGRKGKKFEEVTSLQQKINKTRKMRTSHSTNELAFATKMRLRKDGKRKEAFILEHIMASPSKTNICHTAISKGTETPFNAESALCLMLKTKLSKVAYQYLRKTHKERGCGMYPSYFEVRIHAIIYDRGLNLKWQIFTNFD